VTNTAYQVIIRELEAVLPPRVVSRTLKDGLQQLNREPATVTVPDLERMLKDQVYRQLLGIMTEEKARDTVSNMVTRLSLLGDEETSGKQTVVEADNAAVRELTAALRPFNLYFEWPEVQKLRAQVQLIDTELQAGRAAQGLISEARQQLAVVQQKHEDQLVIQAQDLAELETSFEHIRTLGGPRVRRLENLLRQVRLNQKERQLASGELERARKLATELRKLLESSVYTSSDQLSPADSSTLETPDPEEVAARLRQLDLDSERHQIDQLEKKYANLLRFHPELKERLDAIRENLSSDSVAVADLVTAPEVTLQEAFVQLRSKLTEEVTRMSADEAALATPVGTTRLRQALQVANGILLSTLPDPADISHIRDLYDLAREQVSMAGQAEDETAEDDESGLLSDIFMASRQELLTELYQIDQEARMLSGAGSKGYAELLAGLTEAHTRLTRDGELADLVRLRQQLEEVREGVAQRLATFPARLEEALVTFRQVERLNSEDVASAGRILRHLDDQRDAFDRISLALRISLEQSLVTAEGLLVKLQAEFEATRAIADQLVSANILDDLLGMQFPGADPAPAAAPAAAAPAAATPPGPAARKNSAELNGFMARLQQEQGVLQAALLDRSGQAVAGQLTPAGPTSAALQLLERSVGDLGSSLGSTPARQLMLELDGVTLIMLWPAAGHRLVLLADSPASAGKLLPRLRHALGKLEQLLDLAADAPGSSPAAGTSGRPTGETA
jgi:hypothetical protein